MLDAFKLTAILISGILWGAWLVLVLRKKNVHPLRETLEGFSRLGWMKKVGVLFIVVQLTMFGGAKHGGTNDVDDVTGTNQVEIVGGGGDTNAVGGIVLNAPQPMSNGPAFLGACGPLGTTAPTVMIQPYRLEAVTTNSGISYALPADGAIRGTWHLTGAYEDVQKVTLDGFAFPLGSDLCTSLWAYTWGKVRPQLKNASNEIAAVDAPMSAIPEVSRFWTAATSNDTYLLTWENFTVGRQSLTTNNQQLTTLSAQLELKRNGDFITRSNEVECVYRRVIESNHIDYPINPPDPDDPSRPLYPYGPVQDLSVIEETNAYCWVDIVVNTADAWVRFEGDGASNLADPSFAAKAGETNHVVILIGKTYKVTCDMPFAVVGKSDPSIDEWWEDGNTLWLNWPVSIWSRGDDDEPPLLLMSFGNGLGRGKDFTMFVVPSCLGGEFSWTNSCCAVYGSGTHFSYGCDEFCLCGGCSARGYYSYEGYRIGCDGNWCGCSWYDDDDRHGEDDPDDPEPTPGVSVSFSKEAVIFEDEYTNMPGEVVQWQSTTTKLTLEAHGGMKGGTATFMFTNKEKLIGPDIPTSITVPAGHCKTYEFTYRGNLPSGNEEDITVHGEFHENNPEEGSQPLTSDDELTSVKVEIVRKHAAPAEVCSRRHVFGIQEGADCNHYPSSVSLSLSFNSSDAVVDVDNEYFYCPWSGGDYELEISALEVEYVTPIRVVEPSVVCRSVEWDHVLGTVGCSGQIRMNLFLYVEPSAVSFDGIFMEEIPDTSICPHDGYFNDTDVNKTGAMSHSESARAGVWIQVHGDEWAADRAERSTTYPQPWIEGWKEWQIPVGWGDLNHTLKGRIQPNPTTQLFTIAPDGTATIRKYNHTIERRIDNSVYLDGVYQQ